MMVAPLSRWCSFTPDDAGSGARDGWLGSWFGLVVITASVLLAAFNDWGWMIGRQEVDFDVYLMGARHVTAASLYLQHLPTVPRLPFTYPPIAAIFFWPLAQLPVVAATILWGGINLVALLVVVAVPLRILRPGGRDGRAVLPWRLALALLGPAALLEPVMLNMSFGQINIVLTALILVDVTGRYRVGDRTLPRGLLVGFAAAMKLTPLIVVAYFVVTKQWRAARTAVATFVVCIVVPFTVNPHASFDFWTVYVHDVKRIGGAAYISNQSLQGAVDRLSHHVWSPTVFLLPELVLLALGLFASQRLFARGQQFFAFLVTTVTGYIVSPISWCHHMILVIAVVAWLWWGEYRDSGRRYWAAGVVVLYYWAPMWHIPHDGGFDLTEHGWSLVAGSGFFWSTVVFLAAGLWCATRSYPPLAEGKK